MPEFNIHIWLHIVFSTRDQQPLITPGLEKHLWPCFVASARAQGMRIIAVGGMADHVHLLLSLPDTISVDDAVAGIKSRTSNWVNDCGTVPARFAWQTGYGAVSLGPDELDDTIEYIESQPHHHRNRSYREEFIAFLDEHGIEYDVSDLWE